MAIYVCTLNYSNSGDLEREKNKSCGGKEKNNHCVKCL